MKLWQLADKIEAVIHESVDRETGELSDETFKQLDELDYELDEKIRNCAGYADGCRTEAEGIKQVIRDLQSRARTLENHAQWMEAYIGKHAPKDDRWQIRDPRFIVDWAKSERVETLVDPKDDPELKTIDPRFVRRKTVYSVDKKLAREYLKDGHEFDGLKLTTVKRIRIRRGGRGKKEAAGDEE